MQIQYFCDKVAEKTDGQVIIKPYYESVLGSQAEMFAQASDNELDFFYGNVPSSYDQRFAFKAVPFLLKDADQVHRLLANKDGELYKMYNSVCEEI